jgi:hypothetical protein
LPSFYTDSELEQVMLKLACFFLFNLIPLIVIFQLDDEEEQTDDLDVHDFYELVHLPL